MKRFITIILALSIVVLCGTTGFAQEDYPFVVSGDAAIYTLEDFSIPDGSTFFQEETIEIEDDGFNSMFFNSPSIPFEDYIVDKLLTHVSNIDVSAYGMNTSEFENAYYDVVLRHPELMVQTKFKSHATNGIVKSADVYYYFETVEEVTEAAQALNAKVNEYVAFAQKAPDDLGKLLLVHDKIAYDYYYDNNSEEEHANGDYFAHHPYGFILRGKAVCQGYAGLLYAVASELGIEADFCNADAINHIWNYIKLDGQWYHVDLTWDDPTYYADEAQTQLVKSAYHRYFLRSDDDFVTAHGAKSTYNRFGGELYECSSTKFEGNHLFNLPYLVLINYSGGNYILRADSEVTFEYPTLYTGPMLVTKPYEWTAPDGVTPICKIVYLYTGQSGREYISFVRRVKDGTTAFGQSFSLTTTGFRYSFVPKRNDGAEYSFYFFDRTSLSPLSVKYSITDN